MSGILCVGHAVQDYIFHVRTLPSAAEKYQAHDFSTIGGGPAANAAIAIARLGGEARLAARVGCDPTGTRIIEELTSEGVDCALIRRIPEGQSSLSAIMVDEKGERMIVNYLDPVLPVTASWLQASFPGDLDAILVDTRWQEGARTALTHARRNALPGILDADYPIPGDKALLDVASHIAFSAQGLRAYTGLDDLETALKAVKKSVDGWCCVTDGANGVLIAQDAHIDRITPVTVKARDTLGAGDIWHGAFSYFLSIGSSELEAVEKACAAATIKVMRKGGRCGAPTREELEQFMNTNAIQRH